MPYTLDEIKTKAIPIAIQYGVDSFSLFGSYARGEADEKSDLDFLIQKGRLKDLFEYCGMVADLEDAFNCHVDLVMRTAIKDEEFLKEVNRDEVILYERQ
ncbi:MAG: nucleotidyltransferase [Ruminococcus sp.]|nr:nucleotidyltransferase [Ruminococcus sp.]